MVDSGATHTSVVPVHDGYALQGAVVKTPLAGDFITAQCQRFMDDVGVEVVPAYMVASKDVVKERAPASYVKKNIPPVTKSFHQYMVKVWDRVSSVHEGRVCASRVLCVT